MQVINTNVLSLTSQRALSNTNMGLQTALERLSTGLRINSAKDDAAGLGITERMSGQIRGMNQAIRNANDGISLAQTAEGALGQVTDNLQRIRELSVQSANATNSAGDRAAIQAEVDQLTAEITRVAEQTNFNNLSLLDGSFTNQTFQVGANSGETIDVSRIADVRASQLGNHSLDANGTALGKTVTGTALPTVNNVLVESDLTVTSAQGGISAEVAWAVNSGADTIAAAVNAKANAVGVTATASNSATLGGFSDDATDYSFDITGGAVTESITAITVANKNDLSSIVSAINGKTGTTGITASFADPQDKSVITLTTTDGRNVAISDFQAVGATVGTAEFDGVATSLDEAGNDSVLKTGTVALQSSKGAISIQNGTADVFQTTASSFASVAGISVTSADSARDALATLDSALNSVTAARGDLGAIQNRFESVVASLQITAENLTASRSRIQDADFAAETAALTRSQILQQAGVAMLAQANQAPQTILSLLR